MQIEKFKKEIESFIPELLSYGFSENEAIIEISYLMDRIKNDKVLLNISINEFKILLKECAIKGYTLNPNDDEIFIYYQDGKLKMETGYLGLKNSLIRLGAITSINCQLVYEKDKVEDFNIADTNNTFKHIKYLRKDKGNILGCYCIITLPDGQKITEWIYYDEAIEIRNLSKTYRKYISDKKANIKIYKTPAWVQFEGQMIRKTTIRRVINYIPIKKRGVNVSNKDTLQVNEYKQTKTLSKTSDTNNENLTPFEALDLLKVKKSLFSTLNKTKSEIYKAGLIKFIKDMNIAHGETIETYKHLNNVSSKLIPMIHSINTLDKEQQNKKVKEIINRIYNNDITEDFINSFENKAA